MFNAMPRVHTRSTVQYSTSTVQYYAAMMMAAAAADGHRNGLTIVLPTAYTYGDGDRRIKCRSQVY
jgi:hypothetical protein